MQRRREEEEKEKVGDCGRGRQVQREREVERGVEEAVVKGLEESGWEGEVGVVVVGGKQYLNTGEETTCWSGTNGRSR